MVTQPSFVVDRSSKYLAEFGELERAWLWPLRSLLAQGVTIRFSSDAPVVEADPAAWVRAAIDRPIGPEEAIDHDVALRLSSVGPLCIGSRLDQVIRVDGELRSVPLLG